MRTLEANQINLQVPPQSLTAGTTDGTGVDASDADFASMLVPLGVIDAATTVDCKVQHSDVLGSGYTDISGAAIVQLGATDDNKVASLDVNLGQRTVKKRYVRAELVVAGTGAALVGVILLLRMRAQPVVNSPVTVIV